LSSFQHICVEIPWREKSGNSELAKEVDAVPRTFLLTFLVVYSSYWGVGKAMAASTPALTGSQQHGLFLDASGHVCGVGHNPNGEIGDGTAVDRLTPVPLAMSGSVSSIFTGWYHTIAISGGAVFTWGYNGYGQIGNGTTNASLTPFPVAGISTAVGVAAGEYHSVALLSDGSIRAWGYNGYGQLGDGTNTGRTTPIQTIGISSVTAIAAGQYHTLALKSDGTVWAWGYNGYGQLGNGTTTSSSTPVQVTGLSGVTAIAAGLGHSMALKSDGTVWAWGYNGYGGLGDGNTTSSSSIVKASGLTGVVSIAAGDYHSAAVKSDGTIWVWGYNGYGQIGNGTTTSSSVPTQTSNLTTAKLVGAGTSHTFVMLQDGTIWAWGNNSDGQLGDGDTSQTLLPVAQSACAAAPSAPGPPISAFRGRLAASQNFSLAVNGDGTVKAWGKNPNGELGDGTTVSELSPVQSAGVANAGTVAAGYYHSLTLLKSGAIWSWGYNGYGELASGNTSSNPTPSPTPGTSGYVAVAAGQYHSLGLLSGGTVRAWGYNGYGQLGDGTTTQRVAPVQTVGISGVVAIAAGQDHSLALKSDGTVWAWGYNGYGQLGNGGTTNSTTPVQVAGLSGVTAIAAGANHSMAIRNDGTVWTWGYNGYGGLGAGNQTSETRIVRASDLTNVVAIAAGDYHSLAVKSDGTVWAWGYNGNGQLGNASVVLSPTPVQVVESTIPLTGALAVAAGSNHSLALTSSGVIYVWGDNTYGQFGVGTTNPSTVAIPGPQVGGTALLSVSVSPGASGSVGQNPTSSTGYYISGTRVCMTPSPIPGYIFSGWGGAQGGQVDQANCITLNSSASVVAQFTPYVPTSGLRFVPVNPCRIADTRGANGPFGGPIIPAGGVRTFNVPSSTCGIPGNAAAYSVNVTVVPPGPLGYLSIWPAGAAQPVVSTLNSYDGRIKSNAVIVPAGTNGGVSLFATNATHAILDINGYFEAASNPAALAFYPVTPCRLVDTRNPAGLLGAPYMSAGQKRSFPLLSSPCNVPVDASAYSLNFTVIPRGPLGYLSVWPDGQTQPVVSTLNAPNGAITANAAIVPSGNGGAIDAFVTNPTDLIIDIDGYFAPAGTGGLSLYNLQPCRVRDTRQPSGSPPVAGIQVVSATGSVCGVPSTAQGLVLNATVLPQGPLGYLSLWANGTSQPVVSTLNSPDGSLTSNMAIVPIGNGLVNAFATNPLYMLLDISAFFAP
jgi:alpha-tubulin suppressor-like RCC1 family protein